MAYYIEELLINIFCGRFAIEEGQEITMSQFNYKASLIIKLSFDFETSLIITNLEAFFRTLQSQMTKFLGRFMLVDHI